MKSDEGQISKKKAFQFRQRKSAVVKMHPVPGFCVHYSVP